MVLTHQRSLLVKEWIYCPIFLDYLTQQIIIAIRTITVETILMTNWNWVQILNQKMK